MKKVISLILVLSFFVPQIIFADEVDPNQTGRIIIGISKNLGLKTNIVEVKICQLKVSSTIPLEEDPDVPSNPDEPTDPDDNTGDDSGLDDNPSTPPDNDEPIEPDSPFRFKREFRELLNLEETNDLAYFEAIQQFIEENEIECDSYLTNQNGKLILENMPIGYYFIYIPKFKIGNTTYVEQPVGVYLPTLNEENIYEYDILIYPKIDEDKTAKENYIPPEPEEPPDVEPKVPETGTNQFLVPIFLIIGIILIIIGRVLVYEKKDR